jgi:hypothetical protein
MMSLSYLFEEKVGLIKYAFSPEGIKTTSTGIVDSFKNLGKSIAHKATNLGDTVYNATHDPDSGASYAGQLLKTKNAMNLDNIQNAYRITKGMAQFREREPERAAQWMSIAKKYISNVEKD